MIAPRRLAQAAGVAASLEAVSHRYGKSIALDDVSITIPAGCMAGLIGPDGVGKSTLLALIAGVRRIQTGAVRALDGDMHSAAHRQQCYARIAYMPQGLGRNLYQTLSVFENLDFIGRLFGQGQAERKARIGDLLRSTGLDPFPDRPAGKLSGGMKQKLSLCGALIHDPDLLILDEPTTGVDPLSRRQFWELIDRIRARRPQMSVVVATAYMEEAERYDWLAAMDAGRIIATGTPAELKARTNARDLEQAFVSLLPEPKRQAHRGVQIPMRIPQSGPPAIEANGLTMRFGDFVAVDHVSFRIEKGEIFGFLGSNGCGKSTTMKMLTGLLPASEGKASLLGQPIDAQNIETRRRVGYMSQSFSLYRELTVRQNLQLHARLFDLPEPEQGPRVVEMLQRFGLDQAADSNPESLPLGMRQRLQLAVAVLHKPEMLILDEPTSGVDPVARDQFWQYLVDLSRNEGVTIFLSTHFMNEAERCDRISLMHAGKVLAADTPKALTEARAAKSLEAAFIAYLEDASGVGAKSKADERIEARPEPPPRASRAMSASRFDFGRLWAYARRESVEIWRDLLRLAFALLGPIILMITFGYGISFDVEHLRYAALDQDQTVESRQLLESFEGSRYFSRRPDIVEPSQIERRLRSGDLKLAVEIPSGFGRDLLNNRIPEVGIWLDGAMPFRAETARGYVSGLALSYLADQAARRTGSSTSALPIGIETRFKYNQAFKSVFAIVPSVIMLMLVLIPAMLTAVGVVREKETGSIANFRSTPVTSLEFLVGKQIPYVVIALVSFLTLLALSLFLFGVPVKGSVVALLTGVILYVLASTGFGLVISTFTRTQVGAIFATAVIAMIPAVNFSGLLVPVSSLSGAGRFLGLAFPAAWFQQISVGTFTKSLGFAELWINHLALAVFAVVFIGAAAVVLRKQEA
ncbi:MAG: ribosome-associated ATPase/putative transporter RbbA [Proteobacteria bacterium]|nr:ribosome-associated ATPase/putative transporter RbbA [Pseudomonadota bacterium]